ncbi:MAG TPA: GNAT family N-acetyltransferase [Rhodanobacter sp.]|jgi:GNAT superfamily N-acetyltransferase|nr:GNAT family N-acetyltransferase [Rhodanobacter sp.]
MFRLALHMRMGRPDDARAIGVLARRVTRRWIVPDQPNDAGLALLSRLSAKVIREKMLGGQRFHLGYAGDVLVGVSAMRDDSHLVQFFVSTRYQRRGIARQLWLRTMRDAVRRAGTHRFTLNATRCAVPVYVHLGFVQTGPEGLSPMGVVTTPMMLEAALPPLLRRKRA